MQQQRRTRKELQAALNAAEQRLAATSPDTRKGLKNKIATALKEVANLTAMNATQVTEIARLKDELDALRIDVGDIESVPVPVQA